MSYKDIKICLITEFFHPDTDATPRLLSQLCSYLVRVHGLHIDVITTANICRQPNACLAKCEEWDSIKIHRLRTPQSNRYPSLMRLVMGLPFVRSASRELLAREKYDLVLVGTNPPSAPYAALEYKRRTGTPYIYIIHDLHPDIAIATGSLPGDILVTRQMKKHQKKWLNEAAAITVLGQGMAEYLGEFYSVQPERCVVVPNWEDPKHISPLSRDTEFRRRNKLSGFVALYAGNIGISHGIEEVLRAAKLLERLEDLTVFIVCPDKQIASARDLLKKYNPLNVRLHKRVSREDYPYLLALADVCLLSQRRGIGKLAVPSRLYSYMAAGRPTIAVADDDSDLGRIFHQHGCGLLVPPDDPEKLAESIKQMYSNVDLRDKMGAMARKAQEELYVIERSGDAFAQLIKRVLS